MSDRPFIDAVQRGDAQAVARMLGRDARFHATPESWAEAGGHLEIAEALRR